MATGGHRKYGALSAGFELAASVAGFSLIGWWLGGYWGDPRIGLLIGAVLGIIGGMYNLVRPSLAGLRRHREDQRKKE